MTHIHPAFADLVEGDHAWVAEESHIIDIQTGSELEQDPNAAYLVLHGELKVFQENDVKRTLQRGQMFGKLHKDLCLSEHTSLLAQERTLVCKVTKEIFTSFMGAYGSFERWVEAQNLQGS